jgi:mannose-6-phosphate isomerase-like protein (cupin superfamily)
MSMKHYLVAAAVALAVSGPASAQFLGKSADDQMPDGGRLAGPVWSPKPTALPPYVAPNKPIWRIKDILASHRGQADWVEPIVRNKDQDADYISMGPGKKTKPMFYSDNRMIFFVYDGSIKVTIDGVAQEPFVATKGFMVNVPFRHVFTLENVGTTPAVYFEVRNAGDVPLYPESETPTPVPGMTYMKVTGSPGPVKDRTTNPIYVDFLKMVANDDKNYSNKFVWDDHFTSNILRGKAAPVPPDSNKGHFHINMTEFWYVAEGSIGMKLEGEPYFHGETGDIITAQAGRWHRAGNDPSAPISTRIPINPRPPIMHNFEFDPNAPVRGGGGRGRGAGAPAAPAAAPAGGRN